MDSAHIERMHQLWEKHRDQGVRYLTANERFVCADWLPGDRPPPPPRDDQPEPGRVVLFEVKRGSHNGRRLRWVEAQGVVVEGP